MERVYYVYILASRRNGTLYVGVTNDLSRRVFQHREGTAASFTRKYGVFLLVYYERYEQVLDAIAREKRLKRWRRAWKLALIEGLARSLRDLEPVSPTTVIPAAAQRRAGTQESWHGIGWVPDRPLAVRDDR